MPHIGKVNLKKCELCVVIAVVLTGTGWRSSIMFHFGFHNLGALSKCSSTLLFFRFLEAALRSFNLIQIPTRYNYQVYYQDYQGYQMLSQNPD
ncbi:hypothetical protein BpHYR1_048016 [Brachionus plicatilis]|uniref:Uncharacterized protein n=1 Tax=Brachionus plicatilis TaxID=10195 RepID=A0A3M7T9H5_BRAPC|nr:hypothetical protein BpHYR1_048016 [Brachionus plicatilis]